MNPKLKEKGSDHYKNGAIEPIEYILANNLDFCEGNIIKYVTRYKYAKGLEDLEKAKHYLEFLIDHNKNKNVNQEFSLRKCQDAII